MDTPTTGTITSSTSAANLADPAASLKDPTPAPAAAIAPPTFENIALENIALSPTPMQKARRAGFDKTKLAELAATIEAHGVIEPVLVRPQYTVRIREAGKAHSTGDPVLYVEVLNLVGKWNSIKTCYERDVAEIEAGILRKKYELVAGERRYMASKIAKQKTIPAIVRELTDLQVVEMQVIENNQREDLHELVEAEGFEQLINVHKLTVDAIAIKIGKSRSHIYGRLKLCRLCPEARTAFYAGKIEATLALEIARHITPHDLQRQALKEVTKKGYGGEVMSFRRAAEHIRNNYLVKLSAASFDIKSETLVPKAGSCLKCPKSSGNQPELFADTATANVCTDPTCFAAKRGAHAEAQRAAAIAKGQTVISGADAKKIAPHGTDYGMSGYHKLDESHWTGSKHVKVKDVVKDVEPALLQDPKSGDLVAVISNDQLKKALQAKGIHGANDHARSNNSAQRAQERKAKLETDIRRAIVAAIHAKHTGKLDREDLLLIAEQLFERSLSDNQGPILAAWSVQPVNEGHGRGYDKAAEKHLPTLNAEELGRSLLDMALIPLTSVRYYYGAGMAKGDGETILKVAKRLKVDAERIRKDYTAAAGERAAAKKAKKKTAKPAAKAKAKAAPAKKKAAKK